MFQFIAPTMIFCKHKNPLLHGVKRWNATSQPIKDIIFSPFENYRYFSTGDLPSDVVVTVSKSKATSAPGIGEVESGSKPAPRRRRHNFRGGITDVDNVPSFREFQEQAKVRSLYRQFMRLLKSRGGDADGRELKEQIKREFRLPQNDSWNVKRALSEGNRRYKDLSAMLGTSVKMDASAKGKLISSSNDSTTQNQWPWNNPRPLTTKPSPFPKR